MRTNRPLALVLAGLLAPAFLILGPALVGNRVLLDVGLLGQPGFYLPVDARRPWPPPHDRIVVDAIYQFEQYRVYAARAVRSGRLPLWSGLNYCGSPFLAANQTAVFSPYRLLDYLWPGPAAIAWGQLAKILVAALGAYLYFRRDEEERLVVAVDMASEGMVVLSDRWESGWKAFLDGQERPVARVNHAFRGVVVPPGRRMLEFRYEPSGFRYGIYSLVLGLAGGVLWTLIGRRPHPGP